MYKDQYVILEGSGDESARLRGPASSHRQIEDVGFRLQKATCAVMLGTRMVQMQKLPRLPLDWECREPSGGSRAP